MTPARNFTMRGILLVSLAAFGLVLGAFGANAQEAKKEKAPDEKPAARSVEVKTGQILAIENDALVLHNAKIASEKNNPPNLGIPPRKGDTVSREIHTFRPEKGYVTIGCNVHGWMKGYVRVHSHPYAAVTSVGADLKDPKNRVWENASSDAYGTYTIKGVPVGATVKLFAWHEKLEWLTKASGDDLVVTKDTKANFPK